MKLQSINVIARKPYIEEKLDNHKNSVIVSAGQIHNNFYVIVEQIRKKQNELSFKTMYFERGVLHEAKFAKLLKAKEH